VLGQRDNFRENLRDCCACTPVDLVVVEKRPLSKRHELVVPGTWLQPLCCQDFLVLLRRYRRQDLWLHDQMLDFFHRKFRNLVLRQGVEVDFCLVSLVLTLDRLDTLIGV